jgi:hypothetical protein
MKKINLKKDKRGITMLLAIVVSVFVLAVGTSLVSIALKQLVLTNSSSDSELAFYAANTGIECALYWDLQLFDDDSDGVEEYIFPISSLSQTEAEYDDLDIRCAGFDIYEGTSHYGGGDNSVSSSDFIDDFYTTNGGWQHSGNTWTFRFPIQTLTNGVAAANPEKQAEITCVQVTVSKTVDSGNVTTTVNANGINTCDPDDTQRVVERGLQVQYGS